jgi:hypothetical protein
MTLLNGATDTRPKDQVRELAGLLAKGFLRLSRTHEWRERMVNEWPLRSDFTGPKRPAPKGKISPRKAAELTG